MQNIFCAGFLLTCITIFSQSPTIIKPATPGLITREYVSDISMNYPFCGRLSAIAVNPLSGQHIMVAGESGGLFETKNAGGPGRKWVHINDFNQKSVQDILIVAVPGGFETYIATMDSYYNYSSPLVWKRNKDGVFNKVSFSARDNRLREEKTNTYRIIQKSTGSKLLYACGDYGLAYTDTSGGWKIKQGPADRPIYSIAAMKDGSILAGTRDGIYRITAMDATWSLVSGTATILSPADRFALKTDITQTIVLASVIEGTGYRLYGSSDMGVNWQLFKTRSPDTPGQAGGYNSVYPDYDAVNKKLVIYVSNRFQVDYVSATGGSPAELLNSLRSNRSLEWKGHLNSSTICHSDTRQLTFLRQGVYPEKMIITSDGGFHIADVKPGTGPEGFSWTTENTKSGLKALQVYNITGHDEKFFFGTHDNGFGSSADGGLNFTTKANTITCDFGGEGSVVPMYGAGQFSTAQTIVLGSLHVYPDKSIFGLGTRSGVSWNSPTPGWGCPIYVYFAVYLQDAQPAEGVTTHTWKRSLNNGREWTDMATTNYLRYGNLRHGFGMSERGSVPVANKYDLYQAMNGPDGRKILGKLSNVTGSPNEWSYPALNGLEDGLGLFGTQYIWETTFAVNPDNTNHLFAVEQKTGKLKVSHDGGMNWNEATSFNSVYSPTGRIRFKTTGNGPNNNSITAISFCPFDSNKILVGTDAEGVFYSNDGGRSWKKLNNPGIFMVSGFYWSSSSKIFMATYGRGIFRADL